jgi:hypothetical protein
MLKRDALATAIVAEINLDKDWLGQRLDQAYSHHLVELESRLKDPQCWVFDRRERLTTMGPDSWLHRLHLRLPSGLSPALRHLPEAIVYERNGAVYRIDFWE